MSIEQIRERLDKATEYNPAPWRPIVNTAGDRHGVVDATGCIVSTDSQRKAELLAHIPTDTAKLLAAVDAVLALHRPEQRWEPYDGAGISFKTSTEAITAASDVDLGQCATVPVPFDICAECARIESEQLVEMGEDWGYRESLYPCPTRKAITRALDTK